MEEELTNPIAPRIYTRDEIYTTFKSFRIFHDKEPRLGQIEAIEFAVNSPKNVIVIRGETGAGKSCVGMCICKLIYNSLYIVNSKSLQRQITDEYPEAKSLFGRSNYVCNYDIDRTADMCPKRKPWLKEDPKLGCPMYDQCEYRNQKAIVAEHPLRILNFSYFLHETNYAKTSKFSGKDIVICDEGDTLAESVLMNFIKIEITGAMLNKFKISPPRFKTATAKEGVPSWIEWAKITRRKVSASKERLSDDAEKQDVEMHEKLLRKLSDFIGFVDESWIYDIQETQYGKKWVFSPIWVTPEMTDKYLRNHGQKFVLMSATFPAMPALSSMIGIPLGELDFHEMPSLFKPENKPIYMRPVAEINAKNFKDEYPKIVNEVAKIINAHPDHKGLIHTSSYDQVKMIMEIGNDRLITHNTDDRIEKLNMLKESSKPLVLVSPSMGRGVSLDDDFARFIIITKANFPNLGDKQVSARLYSSGAGRYWYKATTAQIIEQQSGRAIRNEDDWCHIYLLDKHIIMLITNYPRMFNKSFRESLVWGNEMCKIGEEL